MENKGISIIICCFNSAVRLHETIKHIALQEVSPSIPWELIVVNNNSTDNTYEIAIKEIKQYGILLNRFQIIDEPTPGLSNARHKGISVAKFEYIIFCDDDNWLNKTYLLTAFNILNNDNKIAAVGGQSEGVSDVSFPDWWDDYKQGYAVGLQAKKSGDISSRKYLWGSGLAFRKSLYIRAFKNFPSLLTDRKGNELSSGGDSEICMRFLLMGYNLYYDESIKFKHYIAPSRLTWEYRKKLFQGFRDAYNIIHPYSISIDISKLSIIHICLTILKNLSKIILSSIFKKETLYTSSDADFIFLATGIKMRKLSPSCKPIKIFVKHVKSNRMAL